MIETDQFLKVNTNYCNFEEFGIIIKTANLNCCFITFCQNSMYVNAIQVAVQFDYYNLEKPWHHHKKCFFTIVC